MSPAVQALRQAGVDVVLCTGSYQGCGRSSGPRVTSLDRAHLQRLFVGSEAMLSLLIKHGQATARDYTQALVNHRWCRATTT